MRDDGNPRANQKRSGFAVWLGRRDKLRVVLATPLGGEKVVVAAAQAVGILSANGRARIINRASPRFCVEKAADCFEDVVLFMAKNGTINGSFSVAAFRLLVRDAKVFCDSKKVSPGHIDSIIAATVGGTLCAIKQHLQ